MSKEMKIGTARYGFTQKKYFKLKDGESAFRILPPLGNLADEGKWSVFYKVHYGYKNTKGKLRVFQSSLVVNRKTKMVEVPDAADQRIKELKAKLEEAKATNNKAVVERLSKLVSGKQPMYNIDSNHYMNVIDTQGNIGVLKIRHRAKTALDAQIKKLREKGIDPLSVDNGRYFVFTRSGTGLDTSFQVDIMQEKMTIEGVGEVNRDIVHKLSSELISRLGSEAVELDKLFKALPASDIERIVKSSDLLTGQSPVVDELFDSNGDASPEAEEDYSDEETAELETAAPVETPKVEAKVETKVETKVEAPVTQPKVTKTETKPTSLTTTAETLSSISDDDFLKSLGL